MSHALVLGTRGSALAMAQTRMVCDALRVAHGDIDVRVERIVTTGDVRAEVPLAELGRGVFVTEIEAALRAGRIDAAVHSAKDLPSTLPDDLALAAFLPRADPRDVLVSRGGPLAALPAGARVGTSSPRRAEQLRTVRPDLDLREMRGNVDTRLRKLAAGEFDAIVLAAAGLIRLGRANEITEWFDPETIVPCVGQGAIAIEARAGDESILALLRAIDDPVTRIAVSAERALLAELGAGCRAAVGALGGVDSGRVHVRGFIAGAQGHLVATRGGDARDPAHVGRALARDMLRTGAAAFLGRTGSALARKRVAITRPPDQAHELHAVLRARGAKPLLYPTIAIEPVGDPEGLDPLLGALGAADWIVFTSANAVRAVARYLAAGGRAVPERVRIAAVGGATADELASLLRAPDYVSPAANASALGSSIPDVAGRTVLFPCGDLARDSFAESLRVRGADVRAVVVYRTIAGPGIMDLAHAVRMSLVDAVLFASPSAVTFGAGALAAGRGAGGEPPLVVCIGATTARAAREAGFAPDAVAATQSVGGLVEALESAFVSRQGTQRLTTA